jgi:hypothetical protein
MEISWANCKISYEVLHIIKEERNLIHTTNRRKANWIGHMLGRNCLLKHVIERKMEGAGRLDRRVTQLLDDLKEERRYWNLKQETLDRNLWRNRFRRRNGPVARSAKLMHEYQTNWIYNFAIRLNT